MQEDKNMKTVLVVDDDPDCLAFACTSIGKQYSVLCACNGEDALRAAENSKPDAIILDVMMPGGKDGFTTFCELRQNAETRHIPVVMLTEVNEIAETAFSSEEMKKYLGAAPSAFLEKPVSPERLLEEINLAIESSS